MSVGPYRHILQIHLKTRPTADRTRWNQVTGSRVHLHACHGDKWHWLRPVSCLCLQYSAVDSNPLSVYVMHPFWNFVVKVRETLALGVRWCACFDDDWHLRDTPCSVASCVILLPHGGGWNEVSHDILMQSSVAFRCNLRFAWPVLPAELMWHL